MHYSVLLDESVQFLAPEKTSLIIDATLGMGGHSAALLAAAEKAGHNVRILGIDQDEQALAQAKQKLGNQIDYAYGNFADLALIARKAKIKQVDGILMDIGVSSLQLDQTERGFSFASNGPLDMRMDQNQIITAAHIVNGWSEPDLASLFFQYGEERLSRRIAKAIVEMRRKDPFQDTAQLAEVVTRAYPPPARYKHPHPATRVFQALRIEVNHELDALKTGMEAALDLLGPEGTLVIISFHSLEDRLVKHRFRQAEQEGGYAVLTKKPVLASPSELVENSRSRSAKLRAIRRLQ